MKTTYTTILTILIATSVAYTNAARDGGYYVSSDIAEGVEQDHDEFYDGDALFDDLSHGPGKDSLSFMESELEGNKCTCDTNQDCAPNEYCKISNCNDHGYSGGRCKPSSNPPPPPPRQSQCYNHGQHCNADSDCLTGGYNPCTTCGQNHQCYTPPNEPEDVGMCGLPCNNNNDCKSQYVGTYNPCMVCSRYTGNVGTQWVCIDPSEMEFIEES